MGSEHAAHKKEDLVPRKLGRAQLHDSLSTLPRRRGKARGLPEEPPRRVGQNAVNRPAAERVKQRLKGAPGSDSGDSLWNLSGILSSTAARVRLKQRHSPTTKGKNGRPQLWTPSPPKPGRRQPQSQPAAWGQLAYQLRPGDRSRHYREILHHRRLLRTGPES